MLRRYPRNLIRAGLVCALALFAAACSYSFWSYPRAQTSDYSQIWAASRAWAADQNPYEAVGPGRAFEWPWPLLYPLPAIVMSSPLAVLPLRWADPMFMAIGAALLGWGLTRRRLSNPQLLVFVSLPFVAVIKTSQWSLLLSAASLLPLAGALLICKPNIGLALFSAHPDWRTAIGAFALLGASVLAWPGWPAAWLETFSSAPHIVAPVTLGLGPLLLLAVTKWRRPEARLLLALACIPHTIHMYETVPLFLIVRTWPEAWFLWAATAAADVIHRSTSAHSAASFTEYTLAGAQLIVWFAYLPCLVMILRRPNEAPVRGVRFWVPLPELVTRLCVEPAAVRWRRWSAAFALGRR